MQVRTVHLSRLPVDINSSQQFLIYRAVYWSCFLVTMALNFLSSVGKEI
jgi:hypothetical protein